MDSINYLKSVDEGLALPPVWLAYQSRQSFSSDTMLITVISDLIITDLGEKNLARLLVK